MIRQTTSTQKKCIMQLKKWVRAVMDAKGGQIVLEIRQTLDILCLLWLVPYSISKRLCLNVRCPLFLYLIIITYSVITKIIKWDLFEKGLIFELKIEYVSDGLNPQNSNPKYFKVRRYFCRKPHEKRARIDKMVAF